MSNKLKKGKPRRVNPVKLPAKEARRAFDPGGGESKGNGLCLSLCPTSESPR